ncbi:MAG TPA: heavy metal translocating P-type ATPase [Burkholderiaceae bacterium]|nr:heavy metal translocating P-type ATPase [Burkholderiaceae bacterium]
MDCPTEEALIRKRLGVLPSVTGLSFNLLEHRLTVEHRRGQLDEVLAALSHIGLAGQPERPSELASSRPGKPTSWLVRNWRLAAGGAAAIVAELFAFSLADTSPAAMGFSLLAIALTGLETYKKGWIALRNGSLNINALMSIAVTGAMLIGQWPEAAMVMFLFAVAEAIEARALQRARKAVESLMAVTPETATVRTEDGDWQTVAASSVRLGATVRVRPGERLAIDGRILAGATTVNQAPITGESAPVAKVAGDQVFAGSINEDGELEYEATATADGSTLARIVRAVQEAQASRAPTQRFVDKFSAYYTPAVVAVAAALALVPPLLLGADWSTWTYRALVLLVVACPCALVISTPVTVVSGLTAAARRGILIKGGLYLEGGDKLEVLALDKTGTLTHGKPAVTDVLSLTGTEAGQLRRAVALSSRSDHPVSRAITAYGSHLDTVPEVSGFAALRGRGIEGVMDGVHYRLGNQRLLQELGASTPELEQRLDALEKQGKTCVVLVGNGRAMAIVAVADTVRQESAEAVEQLKQLGVEPVMLTGDNRHTAEAIAQQVGITDVRSELLPQDKLEVVSQYQSGGKAVGMVGDGINDAPALAKADIGFAMGAAGTDTAIETADVALMDDDPRKLATFVKLSRATKSVLRQNIALALGIKAVFLALAVVGQATLWMAVFADVGASLIVVFNGLRLLRKDV